MRVILHGFGSFPVFFLHMVAACRERGIDIEWAIVLNVDIYEAKFVNLLGRDNVLVLSHPHISLSTEDRQWQYPGYIHKDIDSEKRRFKFAYSEAQLLLAMDMYRYIRKFAAKFSPTHALVSQVEGLDGKIFIACAREMGASVIVPTHCRSLGGIFFSPDDRESLPEYATGESAVARTQAEEFVSKFRESPTSPVVWSGDLLSEVLPDYKVSVSQRTMRAVRRWVRGPLELDDLRVSILNNLPALRDSIWGIRKAWNQRYHDLDRLESLPRKFIFYPLQYSPESSINTPAPYFVDQMRAIDAIRHAMPSDYMLVIKEHPACILIRNGKFVRNLQHTSGIKIAHYSIDAREIIRHAALTISVTGTATMEAYLLGRPAITLGSSLVSDALDGVCPIDELPERINKCLRKNISDEEVYAYIARLFDARHEVNFGSPGSPGEPVLRVDNIQRFFDGMLKHCRLSDEKKLLSPK